MVLYRGISSPSSPQIHVSIQPVADDVGAGASRAAAHDDDDDGLHGHDVEGQGQGEGGEGHDAELAEEADEDAPGPLDVAQQLVGVHGAAHGEHDHGQHDGEHRAQHHAQDGVEVAGGHQAVGPRADGGHGLTLSWHCVQRHLYWTDWRRT